MAPYQDLEKPNGMKRPSLGPSPSFTPPNPLPTLVLPLTLVFGYGSPLTWVVIYKLGNLLAP